MFVIYLLYLLLFFYHKTDMRMLFKYNLSISLLSVTLCQLLPSRLVALKLIDGLIDSLVRMLFDLGPCPFEFVFGADHLIAYVSQLSLRITLFERGIADRVAVPGQDCHAQISGAHTGDVSAEMIADLGGSHVIVGHSERRTDHGETDAIVKAKAEAALRAGLIAIVCVGETEAERRAGETLAVLQRQVIGSLPEGATMVNTVIAYEPVWAIGTGLTPSTDDIVEAHAAIRATAAAQIGDIDTLRILYGGSVKPGNAADFILIDPDTVGISRTRRLKDLPAGGERLVRDAPGLLGTWVNGVQIFDGSDYCPVTGPGAVLRRKHAVRLEAAE